MKAYLELIRVKNGLLTALAVYVGFVIASAQFIPGTNALLAMLASFLILGAGNTINDYYDRKIDKRNKKYRPIPSGRVSAKQALYFAWLLFAVGNIIGLMIGFDAFVITLIVSALLYSYAAYLSKKKYFGNIAVGLSTGLTFIFGASAIQTYPGSVILLAQLAALNTWAREIYMDIKDEKADKPYRKSLPMIVGRKTAVLASTLLIGASILLSPLPFLLGMVNFKYLVLLAIIIPIFVYIAYKALGQKKATEFEFQAKWMKIAQFLTLIAFVVGIF